MKFERRFDVLIKKKMERVDTVVKARALYEQENLLDIFPKPLCILPPYPVHPLVYLPYKSAVNATSRQLTQVVTQNH